MKKILLFITIIVLGTTTLSFAGFEMAVRDGLGFYLNNTSQVESDLKSQFGTAAKVIKYGIGGDIDLGVVKTNSKIFYSYGFNIGYWKVFKEKLKDQQNDLDLMNSVLIPVGFYGKYDLIKNYFYIVGTTGLDFFYHTTYLGNLVTSGIGAGIGLGGTIPISKKVFFDFRGIFHITKYALGSYDYTVLSSAGLLTRF